MINDLKDLRALFKLCRAQGVKNIKFAGVDIEFGDMPLATNASGELGLVDDPTSPYTNFPQGELTPEQLIFYSAGGLPENDPYNKEAM